jgi:DNA-binding CsgD family transcriptional regulator
MARTILAYSILVGAAAFALQWAEYQYFARVFTTEVYIVLLALAFTALGVWVGIRLAPRGAGAPFETNERAMAHLGISRREVEVLTLLAEGHSNKEIARSLVVSPNTVKTHLASLYGKLEVSRRTQAIQKAKALRLIR